MMIHPFWLDISKKTREKRFVLPLHHRVSNSKYLNIKSVKWFSEVQWIIKIIAGGV